MINRSAITFLITLCLSLPLQAQELEGDYLYKVSTVRAAPGQFSSLLDWMEELAASDYFDQAGEQAPLVMRHSQGDQWDLMLITPMQDWSSYYNEERAAQRSLAAREFGELLGKADAYIAFDEDHFAYGPSVESVNNAYADSGFFHIEMFAAAPGKSHELLTQRQMENDYLAATGQTPNMIFYRAAGSDIDVFTIGFHPSLLAFATPSDASDADRAQAAVAAGFKDRADISFYLRSLLAYHHDTLAVKPN